MATARQAADAAVDMHAVVAVLARIRRVLRAFEAWLACHCVERASDGSSDVDLPSDGPTSSGLSDAVVARKLRLDLVRYIPAMRFITGVLLQTAESEEEVHEWRALCATRSLF